MVQSYGKEMGIISQYYFPSMNLGMIVLREVTILRRIVIWVDHVLRRDDPLHDANEGQIRRGKEYEEK